ncbi:MAG: LytTR family DNA-binding domain-containing protein [Rudanella sp.]|nr:LytTR family DNA-binding domain-containing protein [Rudanella sp.]
MIVKHYLVIDDKEADVEYLVNLLDKLSLFKLAAQASSLDVAIAILASQRVDLIFLDIRLANQSGLTLLKAHINLPPVIIISAYPEYAVDSYEIGKAADYLLKPYSEERLHIALSRALQYQPKVNQLGDVNGILLKMGRKIQRFNYQSINYAEAFGVYSKVYTDDQVHVVNERLIALTNLLPDRYFIRVHKSYLININKITSYDRHNFYLGKIKIPIGISYRPRLEGLLAVFDTVGESEE